MRRIESIEDEMRGTVTYDLENGRYISLDARTVRKYGLEAILKLYGVEIPTERVPVFQSGRRIGTVPALFEPSAIKSRSFLYDVRPGDFKRTADGWEANNMLGPGDLDAIPEFVRDGEQPWQGENRMADEARGILEAMSKRRL